jgi:hypothetical protein
MKRLAFGITVLTTVALAQTAPTPLCEKIKPWAYTASDGRLFTRAQVDDEDNFDPYYMTWLEKIVQKLASKGVQLIAVPMPGSGSVYFDQLVAEHVGPKDFLAFDMKTVLERYSRYITEFEKIGIPTVNVVQTLRAVHAVKPDLKLFFKYDGHWTPDGARIIANEVSKRITGLTKKKYELAQTGTEVFENTPAVASIRNICPQFSTPGEEYATFQASDPNASLLGDEIAPVMLFGSSYSGVRFGFTEFLKTSIGADVIRNSLDGGLAFGAMLNEFSRPGFSLEGVKYIVWEFPLKAQMVNFPNALNDVPSYRQLLPALDGGFEKPVFIRTVVDPSANVLVNAPNVTVLRVTFPKTGLRSFKLLLQYRDFTESFPVERPRGTNFSVYYVQLNPGVIRAIRMEQSAGSSEPYKLELH